MTEDRMVAHRARLLGLLSGIGALTLITSWSPALAEDRITIQYSVRPASEAKQGGINRDFRTDPVFTELSEALKTSEVRSGDVASQPFAAFVKWNDNSISSFPLFLVAAFEKQQVEVDFSHVIVTEDTVTSIVTISCVSRSPASIEDAFDIMSSCGAATRWLRSTDHNFSPLTMKALSSWLIANRFLYVKKNGTIQFSPYGLEPDLIDALKEVADKMDENPKKTKDFLPLKRSDIANTLKDKNEEAVRIAAFVPSLVKDGRLPEAFSANKVALQAFEKLSGGDSSKVIVNVTRDILKNNADYIATLAQQSKVELHM
ncbi:hypothetical protein X739_08705 [Mesorhizobium sp. LNHC220B00]|nr:hypothetical protein [Mesorhizobium sp. LNHC220B00]ESY87065.1 hypothetical protein X739_08705 [Mesorhizobium sp. LNHC220B00]